MSKEILRREKLEQGPLGRQAVTQINNEKK
jgi:hypothetical protein